MKTVVIASALLLISAPLQAMDFPWETKAGPQELDYCRGFISAGLANVPPPSLPRIELWLRWNSLTREGVAEASVESVQAGRAAFSTLVQSNDLEAIRHTVRSDCG